VWPHSNRTPRLERWTWRATTAQALAQRARIILACAEGKTNTTVAAELRLTKPTVGKWRDGLLSSGSTACWTSLGGGAASDF
jgi:DNA-binding NarL/FixJ family response regulator